MAGTGGTAAAAGTGPGGWAGAGGPPDQGCGGCAVGVPVVSGGTTGVGAETAGSSDGMVDLSGGGSYHYPLQP